MNMKKLVVLSLAVLLVPSLAAQQRDTTNTPRDTAEAGRLRQQIEQRFSQRVQQDLNLTPEQAAKLRATQERYSTRRRTLAQQQVERRRAIDSQMQPGVAANQDSLRKLLDAQRTARAEIVRVDQDEDQEMSGYLTPVQRARYQQMRGRLMERVQEMRLERRDGRMGRGMPAPRPGVRGGRRGRGF
jgi:Spy/CpxP family protein refolding chaperone